jgi:hypothetical protein
MDKEINFLVYNTQQEDVRIDVAVKNETIWLTQKVMAVLFDVQVPAISKHLKNIFEEGELAEEVVVSKMEITTIHGAMLDKTQTKETNFYNLDAIISVGYRINSSKATQFRIWATKILKEFITKGFVLDDERLKQGKTVFGKDYFRELLERVRSIRASETAHLATNNRYFCRMQYGLQQRFANNPKFLRHGAKQVPLRHRWTNRSRNYIHKRQQKQRKHGFGNMGKFTERTYS